MKDTIDMKGTSMRSSLISAIAVAIAATSLAALGHGTEDHGKKPAKAKAAKAEETSFGRAGDPRKVDRTIPISMSDQMRYDPSLIQVKVGETIRFVVANNGKVLHEIVLGTDKDLREHAELMRKFPDMEHDEPHMAHVKAGAREDLVWQFTKPGEFTFACLIPGHFEAGMVGKVVVAAR